MHCGYHRYYNQGHNQWCASAVSGGHTVEVDIKSAHPPNPFDTLVFWNDPMRRERGEDGGGMNGVCVCEKSAFMHVP